MNIKQNFTRFGIGKKYHVNRKYKDQLFRFLFRDKEELLSLYNAIHGTNYTNAEDLTITTIEDVLYLGMKNDLSFLIGHTMNLYEHQSTYNPNMPLRGLFYFADLYRAFVDEKKLDIYKEQRILLPVPKYIIFYNGTKKLADSTELLLSESFSSSEGLPALECRALMLNINYGHNRELLAKCKRLDDYAFLIHQIKLQLQTGMPLIDAVNLAVETCITQNRLKDILIKNRAEVTGMLLTERDAQRHYETLRHEGWEDGFSQGKGEGIAIGKEQGQKLAQEQMNKLFKMLIADNRIEELHKSTTDPKLQKKLLKEYGLTTKQ